MHLARHAAPFIPAPQKRAGSPAFHRVWRWYTVHQTNLWVVVNAGPSLLGAAWAFPAAWVRAACPTTTQQPPPPTTPAGNACAAWCNTQHASPPPHLQQLHHPATSSCLQSAHTATVSPITFPRSPQPPRTPSPPSPPLLTPDPLPPPPALGPLGAPLSRRQTLPRNLRQGPPPRGALGRQRPRLLRKLQQRHRG